MREQSLLGQQLGNYRLMRLLGRGAFAEVYLGEHLHLGIQAAIKVLHTDLMDDEQIELFRSEARLVAHLVHPHIVQVLEFGVEHSIPFLVMRYAPGGTLRQLHPKGSRVFLPTIVAYVKQVASALQYAHDEHLIHRDVKPENMLIGSNHEILLSDFGIALVAQTSRQRSLQEVAGTAIYMAPEQFRGDARTASDQYALGVVVYEWLCGARPFKGSFSEIASQHLFMPPPPLHERLPDIAPAVEQVVFKALAKDPSQRFGSVWEFAVAFEQVSVGYHTDSLTLPMQGPPAPLLSDGRAQHPASGQPALVAQSTSTPPSAGEISSPVTEMSTQKKRRKRPRSRRALLAGFVLTGLAGAGIAAGMLGKLPSLHVPMPNLSFSTTPTPRPTPTPSPASRPSPAPTPTVPVQGTTLYTYHGHHDIIEAAVWSPDGKRIASASKDRTVQVWDAADGGNVFIYTGHSDIVDAVAWSPDGKRIASASLDKTVRVWDATDGGNVFIYTGHTNKVATAIWSPDGKRIASGGNDRTIQVWSSVSGALAFQCIGHSDKVWALAWSPDGTRIASASADKTVKVWDATNGRNIFTYNGHIGIVDSVAWSPDGTRIASAGYDDNTVQVWDAANGGHPFIYRGHSHTVWWAAWSPDSRRIASASEDRTVRVWDATDGGHLYTYGQSVALYFVAWSPDGTRIVSGGNDTTVQIWQAV
ncbi:MAG: serine/threonine protein kinase [Chloroflexi bacterium]|nr:serine/threonine protein kinase [Chloroflexota bacterium]